MAIFPDGRQHTREDSGIRLDRNGQWWHDEQRIEHPKIIEAFNRGLSPTDDGRFRLQFGNDWCYVQVEDAAYRVLGFFLREQTPWIELSDRTSEPLDVPTLSLDPDGVVVCQVKGRRAKARFSRDAQFSLGDRLSQLEDQLVLEAGSRTIPVPLRLWPKR